MRQEGAPGRGDAAEGRDLRVLHVNHTGVYGGAEHALARLLQAQTGVEAHVACPDGPAVERFSPHARRHQLPEVTATLRLHPTGTLVALVGLLRVALSTRRLARHLRPDAVHANSIRSGLACALVPRGPRVVVHVRDAFPGGPLGKAIGWVIRRRADQLVAISEWVRLTVPDGDAVVVDDCVDPEIFRPDVTPAGDLGPSQGVHPVIGLVAQITPWKGQDLAVDVLARVRETHPAAELILVGEVKFAAAGTTYDNRGYRRDLDERITRLGLGDVVRFTGERPDVAAVIRALDVLLVPSWAEPFGLTVIEAMACGTPVVATSEGGPATTITVGVDGYLAPPKDVPAWVVQTERAIAAGRAGVAAGPGTVLDRFSPERHARSMRRLFAGGKAPGR